MLRTAGAVLGGVVVWVITVIVLNNVIEWSWPDYKAAQPAMAFTIGMMVTRLSMSAFGSLLSGYVAALIGRDRYTSALGAGALLFLVFTFVHIQLWAKFPVWYHVTFLSSLPILSLVGAWLMLRMGNARPQLQS